MRSAARILKRYPFPRRPNTFKSPTDRFTIVERWVRPDYIATNKDCSFGECSWKTLLHFAAKSKPEVVLADEPESYAWPADHSISADEKWISLVATAW